MYSEDIYSILLYCLCALTYAWHCRLLLRSYCSFWISIKQLCVFLRSGFGCTDCRAVLECNIVAVGLAPTTVLVLCHSSGETVKKMKFIVGTMGCGRVELFVGSSHLFFSPCSQLRTGCIPRSLTVGGSVRTDEKTFKNVEIPSSRIVICIIGIVFWVQEFWNFFIEIERATTWRFCWFSFQCSCECSQVGILLSVLRLCV